MNVLYDHQIFSHQKTGGISRYFCEIISELDKDDDFSAILPLMFHNNIYLNEMGHNGFFVGNVNMRGKTKLMYKLNELAMKYKMSTDSGSFDIVHPTYYDPYILNSLAKKPMVLTIYDMTHERFPEFFSANDSTTANKLKLANRADAILAISESTKNDIVEFFNVPAGKITVTHLASSFHATRRDDLNICDGRFILFVGSRAGYKNFTRFVEAMGMVADRYPDITLLCAGGGSFNAEESLYLTKCNVKAKQIDVSDEVLASCYADAELFVFPSLYEGFGLPILEAFSMGCPVCISSTSSLPEVAGNAAVSFDPSSSESIAGAIVNVLGDRSMRESLIKSGHERLKEFSWEKTAQETKNVYKSLV